MNRERVGDPSEMEQGLNAVNIVRGHLCLICVLRLSCLESNSYLGLWWRSDFYNEV